jgi:hypothetical protein
MSKEWKLVPVEPTDEMKEAGAPSCEYTGTVCAALCYEAMIAVAPEPPQDLAKPVAYLVTDIHGQKKALRAGAEGIERHRNSGSSLEPLYTSLPAPDIEAAAKKLAACMDYPWEHMPEQGRASMREHAKAIVSAALSASTEVQS